MTKEQLLQTLTEDSFNGVITIPDFKQRVQDYAKMYHTEQCDINGVGNQRELLCDCLIPNTDSRDTFSKCKNCGKRARI